LGTIVSPDANLTETVRVLIDWTDRRSRVQELIDAALAERPNHAELALLSQAIGEAKEAIGDQSSETTADAQGGQPLPGSVVVDIDDSTIQGSTFSINVGGGGRRPNDSPSAAPDLSSTAVRQQVLRERLELLIDKLSAANKQYDQTLSAVDKVTLKRVIEQLEEELGDVEHALAALDAP
jgi:hypothetical protein